MSTLEFIFLICVFFGIAIAVIFIFVKYKNPKQPKQPKKIPEADMNNFYFIRFKDLFPDEEKEKS